MSNPLQSPTPPAEPIAFGRWCWQLTKDVVAEYRADRVGDLAASITFWTILSIPAAVLALVSVLDSLAVVVGTQVARDVETAVQDYLAETFTDSATLSAAVDELFNSSNAGVATAATAVALFTLSRAFAGLIRALDETYEVSDSRPFWYVRIVAVGLGSATILIVAGAATTLAILPAIGPRGLGGVLSGVGVVAVLVVWAATVFHVGPHHRTPWRYDLPGAFVTAVGWVIASQAFAIYVRLSAGRNQIQNSVGTVLLALSLLYLLSVILLVGAELNDVIARRAEVVSGPRSLRDRAAELTRRFADQLDEQGEPDGSSAPADGRSGTSIAAWDQPEGRRPTVSGPRRRWTLR